MKKLLFVIVVLALSALALTACGGGGEETSNAFEINIVDEFSFSPDVITVKAGDTVTVTFENTGSVNHNLNFVKPDAELDHLLEEIEEGAGDEHIDEELLTDMHNIEPGHTETVTFTAPSEPGEYSFLCTVPGHAGAGLTGTLVVVE